MIWLPQQDRTHFVKLSLIKLIYMWCCHCVLIIIILSFGWNVLGYFSPAISVNEYPKASNQT